jgi:N-acetyl-gamma-glutamyl-phosphate reductase
VPPTLGEKLPKLFLVCDRVAPDQFQNGLVSVALSHSLVLFHGGYDSMLRPRSTVRIWAGIDVGNAHYYAFRVNRIPVGVLGASGYAGRELCALILDHPQLELAFATANEQRGATTRVGRHSVSFIAAEEAPLSDVALVFSALPHGASKSWVGAVREQGVRAVDLSADLRPGNGCEGIPYGLTELAREQVVNAPLVSNPGCYPTAILTAIAPLLQWNLVAEDGTIVVDAASGVTGAGNAPKRELLFGEIHGDFRAYGFTNGCANVHRHLNEMRAFAQARGSNADLVFTAHLLPVARGILASITVPLRERIPGDVLAPWREAYSGEAFVEVGPEAPSLRDVIHRNVVRISAMPISGTRRPMLLVLSAIDNLLKGAAGQAVQNANLMLGLDEAAGLPT